MAEARHAIYLGNRDEEQINGLHRKTQRKSFNKVPNQGVKGGRTGIWKQCEPGKGETGKIL